MSVEERLARIEGILEQMDKRFDQVDERLSEFREDFNSRLNHVETELRDLQGPIDRNFRAKPLYLGVAIQNYFCYMLQAVLHTLSQWILLYNLWLFL